MLQMGKEHSEVHCDSSLNWMWFLFLLFPPKETFRLFIHHRIPWKSSLKNCHCPKLFTKPQTKGKRSTNKVNFLFYERCLSLSLSACVCLWVCGGQNVGSAQIKACQRALRSKAFMEHKSDPPPGKPPSCFLLLSWRGLTHLVFPLSEPNEKHGGNYYSTRVQQQNMFYWIWATASNSFLRKRPYCLWLYRNLL